MIDYETLLTKGFSRKDARRTLALLKRSAQKDQPFPRTDALVYWILILVSIVGNMIIAVLLVPFLLAFRNAPLYITIALLAVFFGYIFDVLLRDLETTGKEHLLAWLFIPILAVINVFYMVNFANYLTAALHLPTAVHSPFLISSLYVVAYTFPYIFHNILLGLRRREPVNF
ncbi:hypothetical protein HYV84_00965 [Candidatus Woesearchaeota archaeon]|nr:hypothetical protein [Candidatus Woesearchaeota archaeon]